ncbi:MAG: hypothetical protein ABSG51_07370 [Terracidiphilus sp.]|jgi:hypothetical protein
MTIEVEISPEVEASLAAEAAQLGMGLKEYAGKLLEERRPRYATGTGILKPGDVAKMTKVMTAGSENLPVLPPEVNDRASYYEDRW